jgi:hypothetical protein
MVHFLGFMIKLDPIIALKWFLIFSHSGLPEGDIFEHCTIAEILQIQVRWYVL